MLNKNLYNLTTTQKSIWLTEQVSSDSTNNIAGTVYFNSNINIDILKQAINYSIKNNLSLRTKIIVDNNIPYQFFDVVNEINIPLIDLSNSSIDEFHNLQDSFIKKKFKLTDNFLFEFLIVLLPNNVISVLSKFHHIIADAWSIGIIIDNVASNYSLLLNKEIPNNSQSSYLDFINRENKYLESELYKKNEKFWLDELHNCSSTSLKPSKKHSNYAQRYLYALSNSTSDKINSFCRTNNISPYVFFLAVINIYLYRYSSQKDFIIGTPVLNRIGAEKKIFGMFINMISLKLSNSDDTSISDLLKKLSVESFKFFKNSKFPYIDALTNSRHVDSTSAPTYNIVYSFQNMRPSTSSFASIPYTVEWNFVGYQQDELVINVTDINNTGNYSISYDYLIDLFEEEEIELMNDSFITLIDSVLNNDINKLTINNVDVISEKEKNKLLTVVNNSLYNYDKTKTLIDLFEECVYNFPSNIALIYKEQKYTYLELDNMSNIIAKHISDKKIVNDKIAVICKKSPFMIAALLGIMKSGNCYIPIDPEYPQDRIEYIINDSSTKLLLTTTEYKDLYKFNDVLLIDNINYNQVVLYNSISNPNFLAYMIYTSGTTGKPKGVKIKHSNIINTLIWRKNFYNFDDKFSVLQIPSFSFDSSVEDIFTPLISGSKLIIPSSNKMDINSICNDIIKNKITHFLVVPSLYTILLHEKLDILKSLKIITIAGESFPISLVKEHFKKLPNVRMINEYGPTENSVCSTYYELSPNDSDVLIGKPINNCNCYILDKNLNLLPVGAEGELYVSGPGVSEGYLNKDELTNNKFITNPFNSKYKMYKTGDIVKLTTNLNLEFVGRTDNQVKLHGFRIELKEIEKVIYENSHITNVLVLIQTLSSGKEFLTSYITTTKNFVLDDLTLLLKKKLPHYMIPNIVVLDNFPLTPNGKIDRKKLPLPNIQISTLVPPQNDMERTILNICKEILCIENFGITDDFFNIGNVDSLTILTISSRLFANGINVNTQDFYEFSTIKQLSDHILSENTKKFSENKTIINPHPTLPPTNLDNLIFKYNNILLTGATGFLGIHILNTILKNTSANVFCLIRTKNNLTAESRLKNVINYYFNDAYFENYKNRITVIEGELSSNSFGLNTLDYNNLQSTIDCIINSAAITKHYGKFEDFYLENVQTVKNLIAFAKEKNILLNHISTTTISGNFLLNNNISYNFTENDLYIGQNYEDNVYVSTKFQAEKIIIQEEYNGLNANIFRLGNLMARYSDGVFQKNKFDNAYYTRLLSLAKIKFLPDSLKNQYLEFTPIDDTANAIISLLKISNLKNKIFHLYTDSLINIDTLLGVFDDLGITCSFTSYKEFIKYLNQNENSNALKFIISDLNNNNKFDYSSNITINNSITNEYLKAINFKWNNIDKNYLLRFFNTSKFLNDVSNLT